MPPRICSSHGEGVMGLIVFAALAWLMEKNNKLALHNNIERPRHIASTRRLNWSLNMESR